MDITNFDETKYIKNYICLDRSNSSNNGTHKIHWFLNDGNPTIQQGVVNVSAKIKGIVAMRIRDISFGLKSDTTATAAALNRMTFHIEELRSQSILSNESRFHFVGSVLNDRPFYFRHSIDVSCYRFNDGLYVFNTPVINLDSITLGLYQQFQPFYLDPDTITATVVQGSNPARLTFSSQHGLHINPVTISGFTTGNTGADAALITQLNATFTNYTIIDSYTITLPIDLSSMTHVVGPLIVNGTSVAQLYAELELFSLKDNNDN